jgi:hypothetical protein
LQRPEHSSKSYSFSCYKNLIKQKQYLLQYLVLHHKLIK